MNDIERLAVEQAVYNAIGADLKEKMGVIRFKTQVCMMEHGQ